MTADLSAGKRMSTARATRCSARRPRCTGTSRRPTGSPSGARSGATCARLYFEPTGELSRPNTVLSAYLQDEHQLTRSVSLLAGLRHDAYDNSDDATSPRLALIFAPTQRSTFKLLYGTAFRAPGPYEDADGGEDYKDNPGSVPSGLRPWRPSGSSGSAAACSAASRCSTTTCTG